MGAAAWAGWRVREGAGLWSTRTREILISMTQAHWAL